MSRKLFFVGVQFFRYFPVLEIHWRQAGSKNPAAAADAVVATSVVTMATATADPSIATAAVTMAAAVNVTDAGVASGNKRQKSNEQF